MAVPSLRKDVPARRGDRRRRALSGTLVFLAAGSAALAGAGAVAAAFAERPPPPAQRRSAAGAVAQGADREATSAAAAASLEGRAAMRWPSLDVERRTAALAGLAAVTGLEVSPLAASADEPKVTAKCALDIKIADPQLGYGSQAQRRVVIGLFGEEAPTLTRTFTQACTGTYPGRTGDRARYSLAKIKAVSKNRLIQCCSFPGGDFLEEIIDKNAGRENPLNVRKIPLAGPETKTDETNALRHDRAGRVSMSKGGGSFQFVVAPTADASFLDEKYVVIGQVLEGMDVIEDINKVKAVAKGGIINAVSDRYKDYLLEPLRKIQIVQSQLL